MDWRFREHRLRELRGKTVLITGGSRGLGLALAEEFAQFGAKIAICARDEQELARARQQLEDLGAVVCAVPCDVTKPEEVDNLISSVTRHMGGIDVLVNNAGVISVGPILSQKLEDFQEAMDVMFWGTVHPTLAVLPQMLARGTGRDCEYFFHRRQGERAAPDSLWLRQVRRNRVFRGAAR